LYYTNRQGNENREKDCRKHVYMDGVQGANIQQDADKSVNGHNLIT
jgi:hypothetical protein